eukprot:CAMPEP_0174711520 /NCGR_PEP_ID=MMETSP1094-20130205/12804_1 /TAXON_ID=156173 /ORGANISM="Chrysochromulina brevifilum, Strain UTEX LB 985" /LENGTH=867 /DNA_ID=CAMNT_0015910467 /DNA_START=62 /DNA_END=2665 /DNA_ORIENTATION=-
MAGPAWVSGGVFVTGVAQSGVPPADQRRSLQVRFDDEGHDAFHAEDTTRRWRPLHTDADNRDVLARVASFGHAVTLSTAEPSSSLTASEDAQEDHVRRQRAQTLAFVSSRAEGGVTGGGSGSGPGGTSSVVTEGGGGGGKGGDPGGAHTLLKGFSSNSTKLPRPPPALPPSPPPPSSGNSTASPPPLPPLIEKPKGGDYRDLVPPSPHPPPPPVPSPPSSPVTLLTGSAASGLVVNATGDAQTDAHNEMVIDAILLIDNYWLPLGITIAVLVLFIIHNTAINIGADAVRPGSCSSTWISPVAMHALNVVATASAYMITAYTSFVFNHLVLVAINLPAFIACLEMGSTCLALLVINGGIGAVYHSRTTRYIKGCMSGFLLGLVSWVPEDYRLKYSSCLANRDVEPAPADLQKAHRESCCTPEATCGIAICGRRLWTGIRVGSRADLWKWMPAAVLNAATTLLLLEALSRSSLTNVLVWRQLTPLPTMLAESLLTSNAVYRSTCASYLGLILTPIGILMYACNDLLFDWWGTIFAALSMLTLVWEGLIKRHILTDSKNPLVLSLQAMVFFNNAVGFGMALVLTLAYELWLFGYQQLPHITIIEVNYVLCAALLTGMYHYMGLQLARCISAGYVLLCTNVSKVFLVFFAGAMVGDTVLPWTVLGIMFAIGGNVIYMYARLSVMQEQELPSNKSSDHGADVNMNIVDRGEGSVASRKERGPQEEEDQRTWLEKLPPWLGGSAPKEDGSEADGHLGGGSPASSTHGTGGGAIPPPFPGAQAGVQHDSIDRRPSSTAVLLGLAPPADGEPVPHTTEERSSEYLVPEPLSARDDATRSSEPSPNYDTRQYAYAGLSSRRMAGRSTSMPTSYRRD